MEHYNSLNVLPFYEDLKYQNGKKWYAYGSVFPLISRNDAVIPFQLIVQDDIASVISFSVVDAKSGSEVYSELTKPEIINKFSSLGYSVIKLKETAFPGSYTLKSGTYYLILKLQGSSKQYTYYSEVFVACDSVDNYLKITYWNDDNIYYTGGEINYDGDFKFVCYIQATIGKPEYDFEEELTKRGGYPFLESQISSKTYKFKFIAPEFLCDGLRLVRLSDYIQISENGRNYNALTFAYEPEWQAQGDLASVEAEFTVDNIIQKIASFNRRVKESFYNALLVDVNTPLGFDDESIAQYYKSYIQGSGVSNLVNGLLIRELEELKEYKDNYYAVLDTGEGAAKKILLSNLLAGIGENIDTSNFVTTDATEQSVLGVKNFNAGITIGSSKIKAYEKDGCLFIDGNLALTGGLTMYAAGTQGVGSIYDGLPIDNDTIYWEVVDGSKVLKAKGGGGEAGSVQWGNISGKPTWIGDTKPTYNWSEIQGEKPFYTKEEIAEKYVTIDTEQEISGLKHFTPGLSVGKSKKKIYEEEGVVYIDADVAVTGGMTFYATAGRSVSTIMDAVAVDGITIKKENNVLKAVAGAGSSFDENAMWVALATSDSEKQIDKSHIITALTGFATESWVSQNYATASALASVSNKLNDFLEGSDTDEIINKWKELEAFLSGMAETDNLAEILETKADKKYVDSTFVTLGTKQTITGEKTFSSVLNTAAIKASGAITAPSMAASDWVTIAGIKLRKLEDGVLILEGNLAVTGGVTMYAVDPVSASTIMDGVVVDGTTIKKENGKLVAVGGGEAGSVAWGNISGKPSVFATNIANITDLHSSWDSVLAAQKPAWLTAVSIATISDLNSGWDALLKAAPSAYVTRWPTISEVTSKENLVVKLNGGTTEGTNQFTYNATAAKSINITASSVGAAASSHNHSWSNITSGKPTTLAGYGITDAPTKTGSGASGTWGIAITGNAGTATKLQTARTLWGRSFDGTENVSGEISDCTRIRNSKDNSLYLGNSDNTGWVYTQDIASHNGAENWAIGITGTAWFQKVNIGYAHPATGNYLLNVDGVISCSAYTGNYIRIECDDNGSNLQLKSAEINNFRSPLYLQHSSTFNLICCKGGGKVGIGTDAPNGKLHVEGNIYTSAIVSAYGYAGNHIRMECDNHGENIASRIDEINNYSAPLYLQHDTFNNLICCNGGGKVGIGTTSPTHKLTVEGNTKFLNVETHYGIGTDETGISSSAYYDISTPTIPASKYRYVLGWQDNTTEGYTTGYGIGVYRSATKWGSMILEVLNYENKTRRAQLEIRGHDNVLWFSGDILAEGGGTFYGSDIRYKTIVQHVQLLSLNKIAEAPSFLYRWNRPNMNQNRLNLGGSAQYTQLLLPWAVEDNGNFLMMDYATVAYTFAVHTARHLLTYETRTDKKIKKLEREIVILKKQLKKLGYEEVRTLDDQSV